jgi:hypothetical protein
MLPNEIWIYVFESMTRPSELFKVIQSCKQFYALAIRVLYRNVQWLSPFHFTQNISFWDRQTAAMSEVPTSLTVGISHMYGTLFGRFDPAAVVVEADGTWAVNVTPSMGNFVHGPHDLKPLSFFASATLFKAVSSRISSFTKLEELIFHRASLPTIIYTVIQTLPRLRHLCIQYCSLPPSVIDSNLGFASLPITELTLLCVKENIAVIPESHYVAALLLATARNLRILRVDWTTVSAVFFAQLNPNIQYELPAKLEILEVRMPIAKFWPSDGHRGLIDPLCSFLKKCPKIMQFIVMNRLPSLPLTRTTIPNLRSYSGPLSTVFSVLRGRTVEHLEITDDDKKLEDLVNALPELAEIQPSLQTLCIFLCRWDNEVLYPISEHFTNLRRLQIKYQESNPSEVHFNFIYKQSDTIANSLFLSEYVILSLGSQFLYRLPQLHTLQIYNDIPISSSVISFDPIHPQHTDSLPLWVTDHEPDLGPTGDDVFEDIKELIVAWRKHCRNLREVQLVGGVVWRRAFDGDEWSQRVLE